MLLSLSLLGSRQAGAQDYSAEEYGLLGDIMETDLGLERVYVDDTHFYFELLESLDTPAELTEGALTWAYDGQELHSDEEPDLGPVEWTVPDLVLTGMDPDPDVYFGVGEAQRVDLYGRRWLLSYVDYDIALEMRDEYDRDVEALFGMEEPGDRAVGAWETPADAGHTFTLTPTGWSKYVCSGTTARLDKDGAPFSPETAPLGMIGRKVLHLATASCSGTMVDDEWMLTAAHCVEANPLYQVWCTLEDLDENTTGSHSAECSTWSYVVRAPGWEYLGEDNEAEDDYAVVRLITPPTGIGFMPITAAPDSNLLTHDDYLRGYPRLDYSCVDTEINSNTLTTVDTFTVSPGTTKDLHGRHQHLAVGEIYDTSSDFIRYLISTASGASGGPHYYCPTGVCSNGHYITGVNAYMWDSGDCTGSSNPYSCTSGRSSGPKGSAIRDWVIANTP